MKLKTYLVGGAVRDELLNLPVLEHDWVVVGSTPQQMLDLGFQPVGKDFPVFLHPDTHEEYALARTERKTAKGYKGFSFYADSDVTLEEDLQRRDLTINAIAKAPDGTLIDPHHGQQDLKQKCLRHVSSAFNEDPVRILRIARFAAKLPDFQVDRQTNTLMQQMVNNGEVDALVAERVWKELARALGETAPHRFFEVLQNCGALDLLFPELQGSIPKINIDTLSIEQRFSLLTQSLDTETLKQLCKRYKVPADFRDLAVLSQQLTPLYLALGDQQAADILEFLKRSDALRRQQRYQDLLGVLQHTHNLDHQQLLHTALAAVKAVDTRTLQEQGLQGADFARALNELQLAAITSALNQR